ncbi:MAG: heme ABC transporter permease [Thiohalomonadaceae bacterium]
MWAWLHRLASPKRFYRWSGTLARWAGWFSLLLGVSGLYYALLASPPDYQQGESVRIMYVHVPAAWLSMFIYMNIAAASLISLVWRIKVADMFAAASAPIGAWFTFLALVTGALWGKPMWGAWWIWDARLTAELILLFLYLGYIGLLSSIDERDTAARAAAVLALVGVVNIPIIHYSVEWWSTLHQGATVTKFEKPSLPWSMLRPLLLMSLSATLFYIMVAMRQARAELLSRETDSSWVRELVAGQLGSGSR